MKGYGLICGHCRKPLRIRTSDGASITLRTLFLQCTNELCGATYRGYAEVTHQYSPAANPAPTFRLPQPDSALRKQDARALRELEGDRQDDLFDDQEEAP